MEKQYQYAIKISGQIQAMFDEDSENHIDLKELLKNEDSLKAFLHALSTIVPAQVFNKFTKGSLNHLEYNHIANSLCFEYSKPAAE